jgi:hypothetical protein
MTEAKKTKKWYVRKPNPSKLLKGDWVYYTGNDTWSIDRQKAKAFRTKRDAEAFSLEMDGDCYGE